MKCYLAVGYRDYESSEYFGLFDTKEAAEISIKKQKQLEFHFDDYGIEEFLLNQETPYE